MLAFYLTLIDSENDRELFERIYYSHRKQMFTLALSILKNEEDAEDLVHDVFCVIAEKHLHVLQTVKDEQDLKNYLLKATKNRSLNMKRDKKQHISLHESEPALNGTEELSDSSFLDAVCGEITYQELVSEIRSLDKKYEEVLYLHFVLDLSASDVAGVLNRNIHTVKKQLVRGKSILIENITAKGGVSL